MSLIPLGMQAVLPCRPVCLVLWRARGASQLGSPFSGGRMDSKHVIRSWTDISFPPSRPNTASKFHFFSSSVVWAVGPFARAHRKTPLLCWDAPGLPGGRRQLVVAGGETRNPSILARRSLAARNFEPKRRSRKVHIPSANLGSEPGQALPCAIGALCSCPLSGTSGLAQGNCVLRFRGSMEPKFVRTARFGHVMA